MLPVSKERGTERVITRDRYGLISSIVERPFPSEQEIADEIWPKVREILLSADVLEAPDPLIYLPLPPRYLEFYRTADVNGLVDVICRKINSDREAFAPAKWEGLEFDIPPRTPSEAEIADEIWPALRALMVDGLEVRDPTFILPLPPRYLAHYQTADANGLVNLLMKKFNAENRETHVFAHAKWKTLQFDVDRQ